MYEVADQVQVALSLFKTEQQQQLEGPVVCRRTRKEAVEMALRIPDLRGELGGEGSKGEPPSCSPKVIQICTSV